MPSAASDASLSTSRKPDTNIAALLPLRERSNQWAEQRQQASDHESQSCERLTPLNEVAEEHSMRHHQSPQEGGEEAWELATIRDAEQQLPQLSWEPSKQELISTGQEPLVPDDKLKASQRTVRGLRASGPGFQWR